jgi:hypothetical protein
LSGFCGGVGPLRNGRRHSSSSSLFYSYSRQFKYRSKTIEYGICHVILRVRHIGAPTTLAVSPHKTRRRKKVELDDFTQYKGEQRELWEMNHLEIQAARKEGETNRRCYKNSTWEGRGSGTPVGHSGRTAVRREQYARQQSLNKQHYNGHCQGIVATLKLPTTEEWKIYFL